MIDRQSPHSRMTTQTRRREPPSALTRQPALPAAECGPRLGLDRPRKHADYRSIISFPLTVPPRFAEPRDAARVLPEPLRLTLDLGARRLRGPLAHCCDELLA